MKRIVVIGGGISGLATAYRIHRELDALGMPAEIRVLERESTPGGHARTDRVDGFLCEWGPNGFLDNEPRTLELADQLGLSAALRRSNDFARRRFIFKKGRLHLLPESPKAFLRTPLLDPADKVRALMEPLQPVRRENGEESVGDFGRRRLGRGFTKTFLDPMVSGIFAGDVDRLSLPAAFPRMVELERRYGGLFKAMAQLARERKRARGKGDRRSSGPAGPGGVLHTLEGGLETLIRALADELGDCVRANTETKAITPVAGGGFEVATCRRAGLEHRGPVEPETVRADAVVLAVPGYAAAPLLRPWAPEPAAALAGIPVAPVSVVCIGYARAQVAHPLDGFGALFPRDQGVRTLGVIFTSSLFPEHAPEGQVFLRAMIGGARDGGVVGLMPEETAAWVRAEIDPVLGVRGEPTFVRVYRHRLGIPQYDLGHVARVAAADEAEKRHPGLFLTGNSLRGVSLNSCVKDAFRVGAAVARAT